MFSECFLRTDQRILCVKEFSRNLTAYPQNQILPAMFALKLESKAALCIPVDNWELLSFAVILLFKIIASITAD